MCPAVGVSAQPDHAQECCGSLVNLDPDACYRVRVWHPLSDPQAEPDHAFDAVELFQQYRELGHLDGQPSADGDGA
jgi:hypothetical protein